MSIKSNTSGDAPGYFDDPLSFSVKSTRSEKLKAVTSLPYSNPKYQ